MGMGLGFIFPPSPNKPEPTLPFVGMGMGIGKSAPLPSPEAHHLVDTKLQWFSSDNIQDLMDHSPIAAVYNIHARFLV